MDTEQLSHHISSRFNEDLERIRSSVMEMGGLVERQLGQALGGIVNADSSVLALVAQAEISVNQLERSIDEDCGRIRPQAGDRHTQDHHRSGAGRRRERENRHHCLAHGGA
jgi:phosphate uptake regulator